MEVVSVAFARQKQMTLAEALKVEGGQAAGQTAEGGVRRPSSGDACPSSEGSLEAVQEEEGAGCQGEGRMEEARGGA